MGLSESPCGEPTLVLKWVDVEFRSRTDSLVSESSLRVIRQLSSPSKSIVFSSSFPRSMVSNALVISMPISSWYFWVHAASHLCAQIASAVLLPFLKPLWLCGRNASTLSRMRFNVMMDSSFRSAVKRTIGRKLLRGPLGLLGFCRTISVPWPSSRSYSSTKDWLEVRLIRNGLI